MISAAHISKNSIVWWPWGAEGMVIGVGGVEATEVEAESSSYSSFSLDSDLKSSKYDL